MVGARAIGMLVTDPQRGHLALHELSSLVGLPADTEAIGVASLVDGAALLTRMPSVSPGLGLAQACGPLKGRCAVVQIRTARELRPHGTSSGDGGTANLGPFRARSYAAAVVGGPQDADAAGTSRARLLQDLPDFLVRYVSGQSEAEAFFLAVLARLHRRGLLDVPHDNGAALCDAVREVMDQDDAAAPERHVVVTNGVEVVHVARGMPSAIASVNGLSEQEAGAVDPAFVDSSIGRERLRRFRGVIVFGALDTALKAASAMPRGATLQVLPEAAACIVQRDLIVKIV